MGVRLHVEVPAQSFELTLAEVHSLRANLTHETVQLLYISETALRRLWAGSSADDINRLQRLARLQGVL